MKKHILINTSKRQQKVLAVAIVSMFLSACGGGGGSNGTVPTNTTAPTTPTTFTSWSAVADGSTVVVPGMSQKVSLTTNQAEKRVTDVGAPTAVDTAASSFTETLDSSGAITKLVIASPNSSVTFDAAKGASIGHLDKDIDPTISFAINADSIAFAADPSLQGWNYQSFGIWETRPTGSVGSMGVMSIGAPTAGTAIPTSGTATYTGKSVGFYIDPNGVGSTTFSDVSVIANFGAPQRTLALSTLGTVKTSDFVTKVDASNLNLAGTLTYTAGTNSFTGDVANGGRTLSGTSTGRFYGPSAEELGGVFILKAGTGVEAYGAGYGAKRGAIAAP